MNKKKNMQLVKSCLTFFLILLFIFQNITLSTAESSIYTVNDVFQIGNDSFAVNMSAPLKWVDTQSVNITFDVNGVSVSQNETITIITLALYYNSPKLPSRKFLEILTPNKNLTESQPSLSLNATVYAPVDVSEFNISVEIIAKSLTITENQLYELEFPGIEDMYIQVEKSAALPIINLPGFPNSETFGRWIFVFLVGLTGISLPAIFVGFVKLKEKWNEKKVKS
ncbi:MAG: hypothetical protein ACTSUF_00645 [Candidatus Heimdallarchaeaceae archaeon]